MTIQIFVFLDCTFKFKGRAAVVQGRKIENGPSQGGQQKRWPKGVKPSGITHTVHQRASHSLRGGGKYVSKEEKTDEYSKVSEEVVGGFRPGNSSGGSVIKFLLRAERLGSLGGVAKGRESG